MTLNDILHGAQGGQAVANLGCAVRTFRRRPPRRRSRR